MGRAKEEFMEREERGISVYHFAAGSACPACFENPHIKAFVEQEATSLECSYCGRSSEEAIATDLDDVVKFINDGLRNKYEHIDEGNVHYDSEDERYMIEGLSTQDILEAELELPEDDEGFLAQEIATTLGPSEWVKRGGLGINSHEYYKYSWDQFCRDVKHRSRFFFRETRRESDDPYLLDTARLLDSLSSLVADFDLFRRIEAGSVLYRARIEREGESWNAPSDLGPAPVEKAKKENRMSPVGIPMFYGCLDLETCIEETTDGTCSLSVGTFQSVRDLYLLDLTEIPENDIFDPEYGAAYHLSLFLRSFAEAISIPVDRTEHVHVEYIPTQILTEYFRDIYQGVEGILYPSAVRAGATCIVIFVDQNGIVGCQDFDGRKCEPALELVRVCKHDRTTPHA